jgi:hypothetical protein
MRVPWKHDNVIFIYFESEKEKTELLFIYVGLIQSNAQKVQ